ncbi:MAG TPA: dockerin type 1, partial [Promineifilum sp.]|nr:dockerin type 1 [Promineifilum sp.]
IDISTSYEGLESGVITLNAGDIRVVASDDGINVAGGADSSGMMAGPGRGGRGQGGPGGMQNLDATTYTGSNFMYINGGTIVVDANGDGLDANGAIIMTGGLVVVNGPTNDGNGAMDYDGGFNISGGTIVTAGSAGMLQSPDAASAQNSALIYVGQAAAGTLIHIQNSAGEDVLTFAPTKSYAAVTLSSAELVSGETYTVYVGGSATGTANGGLYSDGAYTPGTELGSFTVSSAVTTLGMGLR